MAGSERPKGYMTWNPKQESLDLLAQVNQVLEEEYDELPLTARQIFYMMVGRFQFEKTENAYGRLCNLLVKARRSQKLRFGVIRDEKGTTQGGDWGYSNPVEFWGKLRESGDAYGRPLRQGQHWRIELWCETEGIVPMLARAAQPFGVRVTGTGGFPGITANYKMAKRVIHAYEGAGERPTAFLHLGDYDPSGESIYDSMRQDVFAFVAGEIGYEDAAAAFTAERIGLTEDQVELHEIETVPPKDSDGRSKRWAEEGRFDSAQLEAVPTALLREWVDGACRRYTDMDLVAESERRTVEERQAIVEGMERLFEQFDEDE